MKRKNRNRKFKYACIRHYTGTYVKTETLRFKFIIYEHELAGA